MMTLSDDAKAVVTFTTRLGQADRPSLSPTRWHSLARLLRDQELTPADLFSRPKLGLPDDDEARLAELLVDAPSVLLALDDLLQRGLWVRTIADPFYPARLGHRLGRNAPPVLFGVGEPTLADRGGVAVVGSRNVSPEGADAAGAIAVQAVGLGLPVISGAARGVDQLAMNAAYEAGGSVVGVVADSLLSRIRSGDVLRALDAGSTCLLTIQHPASGFSVGSAMARNKVIYGLADVTVVVASDDGGGGTWAGATESLSAGFGRVAVWRGVGEGPGNMALERRGAIALDDAESLSEVLAGDPGEAEPIQMSLLD